METNDGMCRQQTKHDGMLKDTFLRKICIDETSQSELFYKMCEIIMEKIMKLFVIPKKILENV